MCVYLCVSVFVYACVCILVFVCVRVSAHAHVFVCVCLYVSVSMHVRAGCVHVYACLYVLRKLTKSSQGPTYMLKSIIIVLQLHNDIATHVHSSTMLYNLT